MKTSGANELKDGHGRKHMYRKFMKNNLMGFKMIYEMEI